MIGALAGSVELAVSAICRGENYEKAEVYYISNQTRESSNWKYVLLPNSHFARHFSYLGAAGGTGRHCCFQRVHSRFDLKQRRMLNMLNLLELVIFDC